MQWTTARVLALLCIIAALILFTNLLLHRSRAKHLDTVYSPPQDKKLKVLKALSSVSVSVATINIYNTNKYWRERLAKIAELIKEHQIDVIGVQEVRVLGDKEPILNQAQELTNMLPGYTYVYHKAMNVKNPTAESGTEEGLAIISRFPIVGVKKLSQVTTEANWNDRLVLAASIEASPGESATKFSFVVTHQAIDPIDQCVKLNQLLNFVNKDLDDSSPQILVGDFNTYFDFPYPMDLFTKRRVSFYFNKFQNKNCQQDCQLDKYKKCLAAIGRQQDADEAIGDSSGNEDEHLLFSDVWMSLRPKEDGHTFTNYQDQDMSRPDRILYRSSIGSQSATACLNAVNTQVVGDQPLQAEFDEPVYISDHRMVIAQFEMKPNCGKYK